MPSRRFREDSLEEILSCQGGGVARVITLGASAVAKQTRPINSDSNSMQAQVEPVLSIYTQKQTNSADFGGQVALGVFFFYRTFMD